MDGSLGRYLPQGSVHRTESRGHSPAATRTAPTHGRPSRAHRRRRGLAGRFPRDADPDLGGSPTPDLRATAAKQYGEAGARATTADDAFSTAIGKLPKDATYSDMIPAARVLLVAITSFRHTVFAIEFPRNMAADVIAFGNALNADVTAQDTFISNPSQSSFDTWVSTDHAAVSLSNTIRHDLDLPLIPLSTPPPTPLKALDGKELPGTSPNDWSVLQEEADFPAPATDMEQTASNDLAYSVAIFDFASSTDAASFYATPPPAIRGFVGGALAYTPLIASTGLASPSRAMDIRACGSNATGLLSILPSGQCSNGGEPYSVGVATITQRGAVVVFAAYLTGVVQQHGNPADVSRLTQYVQDALSLLQSVGFR
jgi:hypothetical protein